MPHEAIDSRFHDLVDIEAPVVEIGEGYDFTEGPLWHPLERYLIFSDMPADTRRRWTPDGGVEEIMKPSNKGNGMTYDADLNLLVCEHSTSSVARISPDGKRVVLASHFEGRELNSPNDICARSDGRVYFTDPTYGRMPGFGVERTLQQSFRGVYMLEPGHRPGDEPVLVSDRYTFAQPNGLCLSPCERYMWVNDTEQANIRMFDVDERGRMGNARIFASGIKDATLAGVPDGMKADEHGNVYVTAPGGVWTYSFDGTLLGKISVPKMVANLHWGEDDWRTMFLCATSSVYKMRLKARGRREPFMAALPSEPLQADIPAGPSEPLSIDPSRTAMILQDLQNDVIIDGGAFADSGAPEHARRQNVVANSRRLAEACRAKGVQVIHVWFVCEPGHPALGGNAPLYRNLRESNALVRGTWGAAPVSGLEPQEGDLVVEKMSMSAFGTSRLESYLRRSGRDTILNCGAWTNMSVEHTARTAADKGFRVIVPHDATSTMNADWQRASIGYAMGNVATISSVDEVIATLGRS